MLSLVGKEAGGNDLFCGFPENYVKIIRGTIAKGATDEEVGYLLHMAENYNLDPLKKEIWFIRRVKKEKKRINNEEVWDYPRTLDGKIDYTNAELIIMVSRDGFLEKNKENPEFDGLRSGVVHQNDSFEVEETETDIKFSHKFKHSDRGTVMGAWAMSTIRGKKPVFKFIPLNEGIMPNNDLWSKKAGTMIQKTAEAFVLRRTSGLTGVYAPEELGDELYEMEGAGTNTGLLEQKDPLFCLPETEGSPPGTAAKTGTPPGEGKNGPDTKPEKEKRTRKGPGKADNLPGKTDGEGSDTGKTPGTAGNSAGDPIPKEGNSNREKPEMGKPMDEVNPTGKEEIPGMNHENPAAGEQNNTPLGESSKIPGAHPESAGLTPETPQNGQSADSPAGGQPQNTTDNSSETTSPDQYTVIRITGKGQTKPPNNTPWVKLLLKQGDNDFEVAVPLMLEEAAKRIVGKKIRADVTVNGQFTVAQNIKVVA